MFISTGTLKMVLFQHHLLQETSAKSQCQQICWSTVNVTTGHAACGSQQGTFFQSLAVQLDKSMQRGRHPQYIVQNARHKGTSDAPGHGYLLCTFSTLCDTVITIGKGNVGHTVLLLYYYQGNCSHLQ